MCASVGVRKCWCVPGEGNLEYRFSGTIHLSVFKTGSHNLSPEIMSTNLHVHLGVLFGGSFVCLCCFSFLGSFRSLNIGLQAY